MADSVGQGIALGERFKFDTTSGTALLNKAVQDKFANDRKQEADFVDSLDFKVDYSKTLPAYGKAMTEVAAGVLNKYNQYKKENPRNAKNRIQADAYQARMELGRLQRDNDANLAYINQPAGTLRNNEYIKTVTSMDSNLSDLAKYNDGYFLNVGGKGEFAFRPVKEIQPATLIKYDPQDYNKVIRKTKPSNVPGKMEVEYVEELMPSAVQRNAESLTKNPDFRDNVLAANPALLALPEKERIAAVYDAAFEIAKSQRRESQSDWRLENLPNPSGSGANDDKRVKPVINGEFTESLMLTKPDGTRERKDQKYPWSVDVPESPETAIPLDSRVIDYETNLFLKGEDVGKIVTFKPKKIYPQLVDGKTKLYVIGTAYVGEEDKDGKKTVKEFNYKVPYDKVEGAIKTAKKYDLSEVEEKFKNTTLKPATKKTVKASEIATRAKNAGYTEEEYKAKLKENNIDIIQ